MSSVEKNSIAKAFRELQSEICQGLEQLDGSAKFRSDEWARPAGGGGRTNIIQDGALLEKGGVAFSEVFGEISEEMKRQLKFDQGKDFYATGVSIVLHPENPNVPIIHMNVRYFQIDDHLYWFGGGIDLTPHYIVDEHARIFHQRLKDICDHFDTTFYSDFKQRADDYFFLPHRDETRGVGGIFYDHLSENNTSLSKEELLRFALRLGQNFVPIYAEQSEFGRNIEPSPGEIEWQQIRRGRYVEFNLVHDRGTKFGLHSGGRTESILMSLPKTAGWQYDHPIKMGSREAETQAKLKKGLDWLNPA
ncbi:MAG: oxygen-dependent coproporphyrinogen oxidase [Bacteroidetes bacterium]|nr:MAG: oxygen-dependent coproporphyrinogen oxidase [Bacteroidota bacterium]